MLNTVKDLKSKMNLKDKKRDVGLEEYLNLGYRR